MSVGDIERDDSRDGGALPLPACGERVGVRGSFSNPESLPHPHRAMRDATSPRKRGEVSSESIALQAIR
jgi:hypothetical protein